MKSHVFLSTYLETGLCQGLLGAFVIKMIGLVTCLGKKKTPDSPRNQIPFASNMVLTHQDSFINLWCLTYLNIIALY